MAFCLLLMVPPPATAESNTERALRSFDAFYRDAVSRDGIIGSSFMFIHDNKIVDRQFYGMANLEEKEPVDEETIYHWASITKTFTGIAIMQLRDRGLVKLEDPVVKYVPELRQVHDPYGDISEITIRELMSHTAGFRAATWPWGGDKAWEPFEPREWAQLVAMMPYTEILFKPGSRYSYSNLGVVFLGRIIEEVAEDHFETYVDKNIFKPLEMYHSYFDKTPFYLLKHRARSYRVKDGKLIPAPFDAHTGITVYNGGLNAPLPDMVKYINFLMGDPAKQAIYNEVLKRSSLEEMWTAQADASEESKGGRNRKDWIGLSFFIEDNYGQHFIGHGGYQNAFSTHFYLCPATRTAYLIAYNTYVSATKENPEIDTDRVDLRIKDYLFEHIFPLFKS